MITEKNKQLALIIISFLLIIPFRLPISVIFIKIIDSIANMGGDLNYNVLRPNVILTKLIYNISLSFLTVYNLEKVSIKINKRSSLSGDVYWWTVVTGIALILYSIYDAHMTFHLYNYINEINEIND